MPNKGREREKKKEGKKGFCVLCEKIIEYNK